MEARNSKREILPFSLAQAAEVLAREATNNKINVFRDGWPGKASHISDMAHLRKFCLHDLDSWVRLTGNTLFCHSRSHHLNFDAIYFYSSSDATV